MKLKKIKFIYYIILTINLIFFLLLIFLKIYTAKINKKLNKTVYAYIEKDFYHLINQDIYNLLKKEKNDYFNVYKNSDEEIIYIDYNLNNIYDITTKITNIIDAKYNDYHKLKRKISYLPSDNIFLYNIGPKINLYVNTIDSIMGNVNTKITNYGMNNALIEMYIDIKIKVIIAAGIKNKPLNLNYKFLINSSIINGKIPSYYGNTIKSSFDIPIKK